MAKLYVANTTKQNWEFNFRVPENPKLMVANIAVGQSTGIYKPDMSTVELDSIVRQLRELGAVEASEIDRSREFIGLAYRIDRDLTHNHVVSAMGHNDEVLEQRGHDLRQAAAVAINQKLSEVPGDLSSTTVTVVEDVKRGSSEDGLNETIIVEREGEQPKKRGRKAK